MKHGSSSRHIFTNILNTNLRIFSTKYYVIFVLIFSRAQNWEKMSFLPNKEFVVVFFNWEIWVKKFVDSHSENSWKHVVISIIDESSWSSFPCGFHCLRKSLCKTFVDHGNRQTQKGISKLAKGRVPSRFEF